MLLLTSKLNDYNEISCGCSQNLKLKLNWSNFWFKTLEISKVTMKIILKSMSKNPNALKQTFWWINCCEKFWICKWKRNESFLFVSKRRRAFLVWTPLNHFLPLTLELNLELSVTFLLCNSWPIFNDSCIALSQVRLNIQIWKMLNGNRRKSDIKIVACVSNSKMHTNTKYKFKTNATKSFPILSTVANVNRSLTRWVCAHNRRYKSQNTENCSHL